MLPDILPFRVIRANSEDEVIARAANLIVGRAAYETAVRLYPNDRNERRTPAFTPGVQSAPAGGRF